ncbi:hypothetical protein [Novosphingobium sp. Gsoil 351]|uniref:hypothetical protein n=1 Tax=Novosphingobium sp. Gsoil 351 TaxID=2675225 RepID=UPI0018A82C04|nr:hypothetical protein [Novosphingobium sp. Gsoil 351]
MTVSEHFAALADGRRPEQDGLLGNARCEWQGVEFLGEEAILAQFARQRFDCQGIAFHVETASGAAWIGTDAALFADLYDGRIGRLWRLGAGHPGKLERAVSVAFDPDLRQDRGEVAFRAEDHPELVTESAAALRSAASAALQTLARDGALRVRGFVTRAFGNGTAAAALVAVYVLSDDAPRRLLRGYAAIGVAPGQEPAIVIDLPPSGAWTPRL